MLGEIRQRKIHLIYVRNLELPLTPNSEIKEQIGPEARMQGG